MPMRLFVTAIAVGLLAWSPGAAAMRCGTGLIKQGDHADRVLRLCGEPEGRDSFVIYREVLRFYRGYRVHSVEVEAVRVEIWTYKRGSKRLNRRVRLENGYVIRVETLDQRD